MADRFASFETGFEKPSLDNPLLFSRYADEIATRLGHQFPAHTGYRIRVERKEDDPRKREWRVNVQRGWFTGARVEITPLRQTPHRARVRVAWHSRLLDVMANGFIYISMVPLFLLFLAFAWKTRLGFALILTVVIGAVWLAVGFIAILIVARIFSAIFGNEFDTDACIALADKVQQFPLPQDVPSI